LCCKELNERMNHYCFRLLYNSNQDNFGVKEYKMMIPMALLSARNFIDETFKTAFYAKILIDHGSPLISRKIMSEVGGVSNKLQLLDHELLSSFAEFKFEKLDIFRSLAFFAPNTLYTMMNYFYPFLHIHNQDEMGYLMFLGA